MAGNSTGGKKAALTTKRKYGEDFHKKAGSNSWSDPNRSHKTGFALQSEEARKEAGRKGGKKTKAEYKHEASNELAETEEASPGAV